MIVELWTWHWWLSMEQQPGPTGENGLPPAPPNHRLPPPHYEQPTSSSCLLLTTCSPTISSCPLFSLVAASPAVLADPYEALKAELTRQFSPNVHDQLNMLVYAPELGGQERWTCHSIILTYINCSLVMVVTRKRLSFVVCQKDAAGASFKRRYGRPPGSGSSR